MRNSGCKDGKAEKVEPTEVVEGDGRVQENQNLEVSCTGSVHAWNYDNRLSKCGTEGLQSRAHRRYFRSPTDFLDQVSPCSPPSLGVNL
jgi:hypothetical protein